jgi:hypothetical protein
LHENALGVRRRAEARNALFLTHPRLVAIYVNAEAFLEIENAGSLYVGAGLWFFIGADFPRRVY